MYKYITIVIIILCIGIVSNASDSITSNRYDSPSSERKILDKSSISKSEKSGKKKEKKSRKKKKKKSDLLEAPIKQEYFDLYSIGEDDWIPVYQPEIQKADYKVFTEQDEPGNEIENDTTEAGVESQANVIKEGRGFRVQLINVLDESRAMDIKAEAEKSFDKVYIIFQSPNYRVRVGNYRIRSEADAAVEKAAKLGFRDAWVVPSKIELPAP
ncbi:MAG: SPOR domain-containing protein [Candidatus Electryonea clarkiae]|nr:SPOR domain-containing protein [Candidatus Electryonea clarkiae]MDP8286387.1 SPOR domain-containing protein [Candidatus Electryonea clarkiae]